MLLQQLPNGLMCLFVSADGANAQRARTSRYVKRAASLAVLLVLSAFYGLAQEERAAITGTVTDPSNAVFSGATVQVNNNATGVHRTVRTNDSGYYLIPGLPVGVYDLNISMNGFRTAEFRSFELLVGQTRTFNAQLQLASNNQEVKVEAETPALTQSSATVGGVLSTNQVANLPINGRAWTALMSLVPGAIDSGGGTQKSIRFAGRGNDDNNFRFDGVDATGIANQAPNTSFRLQISTEAVAEFKVDTALYGADTGGTSGGQVEVISKSGSNAFHGSVFEYIRNDKISARGPFDPAVLPPLRLNQFGGSLGGAIVRNKTFFFTAYEGLRQRVGNTLIGTVPSDAFRATVLAQSPVLAPIVNSYPEGNRVVNANVSQFVHSGSLSGNEDSGLIRIDQVISDSTTIYGRYNIDKVALSAPSGLLLDRALTDAAPMNGTLALSHVFSPAMFNVAQLGVNRIHTLSTTDSHFFDTTKVFNSVSVPGFTKLAQAASAVKSPTTYSFKDDFTWIHGAHTIKAGAEIKRVLYNYSQVSENALVYASLTTFAANQLDQVNLIGGVPTHGLDKTMYFGYVQDSWKVTPNLTVNAGLRYEFFNVFHEIDGRSRAFDLKTCSGFCPQGSEFTFPVYNNFEPRVSFAWSPAFLHGKTVIRSGFGLYKGEGQLGDLNAPSDNFTQRLSLSSASFPGLSFPADPFYAAAANQAVTPRALVRDRRDPAVEEWGLQIQTVLPMNFVLDTGYIGYHGYHQFFRHYVNRIDPATGVRPLAGFGPIDEKQADGNNHFHGWQTSLRRQFKSGFTFSANYMWSHAINDGGNGGGESDYSQNTDCRTCDVASSNYDVRHVFSSNTVYELPFGKGRQFLNSSGGIADAVLGGWAFSGIGTYRSGNPVNVVLTRPASALPDGLSLQNGSTFQRPDYVGGVSVIPTLQTIGNWINRAAFAVPANGVYGNAGRNLVRGPNFWQADVSLVKGFRIAERVEADVRVEAFNVFNRAQFGDPIGNLSDPSFGRITTTVNNGSATGSGTPREFQFSLRLKF